VHSTSVPATWQSETIAEFSSARPASRSANRLTRFSRVGATGMKVRQDSGFMSAKIADCGLNDEATIQT
jgi:hypothetical protein